MTAREVMELHPDALERVCDYYDGVVERSLELLLRRVKENRDLRELLKQKRRKAEGD